MTVARVFAGGAVLLTWFSFVLCASSQDTKQRQEMGSKGADFAAALAQGFVDYALGKKIEEAVKEKTPEIEETRKWLGSQGILYELQVAEQPHAEGDPHQLVLVGLFKRAIGSTPVAAMAKGLETELLIPKPPNGFVTSEQESRYLWVKEASSMVIFYPEARRLNDKAWILHSDTRLRQALNEKSDLDRWRQLDSAAAKALSAEPGLKRAKDLISSSAKALEKLQKINKDLADTLERERRAAAASQWLTTLGKGLTLGTQIGQLSSMLGEDAPTSPIQLNSKAHLKAYVDALNRSLRDNERQLAEQKRTATEDYEAKKVDTRTEFRQRGIPLPVMP